MYLYVNINCKVTVIRYIFSLVNATSALKALFLFLVCNVTMLECNVILTLFLHIICAYMVTFTLFVCLFNPNTKFRDMHTIYRKSAKKT